MTVHPKVQVIPVEGLPEAVAAVLRALQRTLADRFSGRAPYLRTMHERAEAFRDRAVEQYDFEPEVVEFPEGTKTAADAAAAIGCSEAQIASSLAFDVDGSLVVCITSGANRVSEAALADRFDVRPEAVAMADPERIRETLGWAIGGVPPLCHETAVPSLIDRSLLAYETVWAAAGTPSAVFPIDPEILRSMTEAIPITVDPDG